MEKQSMGQGSCWVLPPCMLGRGLKAWAWGEMQVKCSGDQLGCPSHLTLVGPAQADSASPASTLPEIGASFLRIPFCSCPLFINTKERPCDFIPFNPPSWEIPKDLFPLAMSKSHFKPQHYLFLPVSRHWDLEVCGKKDTNVAKLSVSLPLWQ